MAHQCMDEISFRLLTSASLHRPRWHKHNRVVLCQRFPLASEGWPITVWRDGIDRCLTADPLPRLRMAQAENKQSPEARAIVRTPQASTVKGFRGCTGTVSSLKSGVRHRHARLAKHVCQTRTGTSLVTWPKPHQHPPRIMIGGVGPPTMEPAIGNCRPCTCPLLCLFSGDVCTPHAKMRLQATWILRASHPSP